MSRWLFEPPTRARSGGSAAEYAFSPKLDVFVREVVQNAKDQKASPNAPVRVHFELIRLRGQSLAAFLKAVEWSDYVQHLRAAGDGNANVRFLLRGISRIEQDGSMLLLRIDDSGTGGLVGGDTEEDQPFSSLCVDELFSIKGSEGAGGSYGLGKSVLWRFSSISTVLFGSYLSKYPADASGLRLFGRGQLPWHKVGSQPFHGTCWFGDNTIVEERPTALSLWGDDAEEMARPLRLLRPREVGTSILVVGFSPPADDLSDDEIPRSLAEAASTHFWPILGGEKPDLEVTASLVEAETGDVLLRCEAGVDALVQPFAQCLADFRKGSTADDLDESGNTARVDLTLKIPARLNGEAPVEAPVSLCVRLAPGPPRRLTDHVAEVRGFGMVLRYRELKGLSLSARHYHAVLLCGELRGASPTDHAAEAFLRLAEPPEHNRWISTPRLRDVYKRGYSKALDELEKAVADALKKLVSQTISVGEVGPDRLSRLFPIGERGHEARDHAFRVKSRQAQILPSGAWTFAAEVERTKGAGAWNVRVRMRPATEDGADSVSVIGAAVTHPDCPVSVAKGSAEVQIPASVRKVRVSGRSDPTRHRVDGRRVAMRLDIGAWSVDSAGQPEL